MRGVNWGKFWQIGGKRKAREKLVSGSFSAFCLPFRIALYRLRRPTFYPLNYRRTMFSKSLLDNCFKARIKSLNWPPLCDLPPLIVPLVKLESTERWPREQVAGNQRHCVVLPSLYSLRHSSMSIFASVQCGKYLPIKELIPKLPIEWFDAVWINEIYR